MVSWIGIILRINILILAMFVSAPATAQEFSGAHVDAIVGGSHGDRGAGISDQQSGDGLVYGIGGGYDVRIGGNAVLGIVGEVSDVTGDSCAQIDLPTRGSTVPAAKGRYCGKEGRALFGGVRAGYLAGERTLLYVGGGYVNARRVESFDGTLDGRDAKSSGGRNLDGVRASAGLEQAVAKHVSLKAEYRYTAFGHDFSSDQHQLVTGLSFRF